MSTTTIRLPDELKQRVARAAEATGTSAHAFIVGAIAEQTELVEQRGSFHRDAEERMAKFLDDGLSVPWSDVRRYMQDRAAGKRSAWPKPRKL
jgi:predicted transcriptional regulator